MKTRVRRLIHQHVDNRLRKRLRIFSIIFLVMMGIVIVHLVHDNVGVSFAVSGLLIGTTIGILLSRMYLLSWDEDAKTVIARMDWIGGGILVLYIIAMFGRSWFFGHWFQGAELSVMTLSITAGTMLGRVLGTRRGILKIMRAWNIQFEDPSTTVTP